MDRSARRARALLARTAVGLLLASSPGGARQAPKPGQYIWHPERSTKGPVVIIVALPEQRAYVYRNGIRIGQTTVSTGRPGHATPTGVFTILQKDVDHHSSKYNNAAMPYMERLTWDGIAIHAGHLPGYPASHGCVRLPLAFSKDLYGVTGKGTTVIIADKSTAPDETLKPGLVLASANLEGNASLQALKPAPGQFTWRPELAPEGPVSILMSGADKTVFVYRNGVLIGQAAMSILEPERPLASGVFVMLEGTDPRPNVYVPGKPTPKWMSVGLPAASGEIVRHDVADRVALSKEFAAQVYTILAPGTTLMVTDRSATVDTTTSSDFTVMATSDAPAPGASKR